MATLVSSAKLLDAADHLAADLGRQRRHVQADQPAVVLRIEAQVARLDGLFDVLERAGIVGANDDLVRLGRADGGHLLDRHGRAVDLDPQRIDQARVGPAGADAGQVALELADGFFHPFFNVQQDFVGGHGQ